MNIRRTSKRILTVAPFNINTPSSSCRSAFLCARYRHGMFIYLSHLLGIFFFDLIILFCFLSLRAECSYRALLSWTSLFAGKCRHPQSQAV